MTSEKCAIIFNNNWNHFVFKFTDKKIQKASFKFLLSLDQDEKDKAYSKGKPKNREVI